MQLPRLLDAQMNELARLQPVSLSLDLQLAPLSTATMILPPDAPEVHTGAYIELFTSRGSAGIFRVQQCEQTFTGTLRLALEHGLVSLADGIIPGTAEENTGTARAILAELLSHQSMWKLGTVQVPDSETLTWAYDYSNLLESLLSILEELPAYRLTFDQGTLPWTLNLVNLTNTVGSECRLSRNLSDISVEEDRSELCTRLHVPGLSVPLDADTIGQYGTVERSLTGDEGLTETELTRAGQQYLEQHKHPLLTVRLSAVDLSQATGESLDAFALGDMCRVCLPDYGQTVNQRIVTISYHDLCADDLSPRLTLANAARNTADALAGLIVDTTVQRRLIYKNGQELDRLVVRTIANEEQINIIAPELNILAKEVEAKADLIVLDAYVKITELETTNAKIDNLVNGLTQAMVLDALLIKGNEGQFSFLSANQLTLAEKAAQWKSTNVGNGVVNISQSKRYLNVMLADGTSTSLDIVTDVSATGGQTQITYLGQQ